MASTSMDRAIEQTALRPGDLVELGAVRLRFQQQRPS